MAQITYKMQTMPPSVVPFSQSRIARCVIVYFFLERISSCDSNNWNLRDFPGGPGVKNPPSNAEDVGLIPGQGTKIPHAAEQLSLSATTTELVCLNQRSRVP